MNHYVNINTLYYCGNLIQLYNKQFCLGSNRQLTRLELQIKFPEYTLFYKALGDFKNESL